MLDCDRISVPGGLAATLVLCVCGPAFGQGDGYRTSVGSGSEEIAVVVVSGTPYEMGFRYGQLAAAEIQAFIPAFLTHAQAELSFIGDANAVNAALDAAWAATEPYTDDRYEAELLGIAAGSAVDYLTLRRVHCVPIIAPYSCSSVAVWDTATADGHLYQTRDLDWDVDAGAQDYPVIILYMPNVGQAHANIAFAGLAGSHTGINAAGIVLSEMGNSSSGEFPYDLTGTHFMPLFRQLMYDAGSLTDAIDILTNADRIKRYHYVFGDGQSELAAVKILAHAPETPPTDLVIWTDNDPTDEYAPNVAVDAVYEDEGRGAYPLIMSDLGSHDENTMMAIAVAIATHGGNVVNVVYDATDLEMWVAFADGPSEAYLEPFVHVDLYAFDGDADGLSDLDESNDDTDGDGTPNYLDPDSDDDTIPDGTDNCPLVPNTDQTDTNDNGIGDACEPPVPTLTGKGLLLLTLLLLAVATAVMARRSRAPA